MPARQVLAILALLLLTLAAYLPVIGRGGFIWDDDSYLTGNPVLRTTGGLAQIWLQPQATPQYYPLVFTGFWFEYHIWGLDPRGYHLVNILLHACNAILLWLILTRLRVPGAWLAAALFALHPVHVESVAWITERKNVLSGLFYLLAALTYLRFAGVPDPAVPASPTKAAPPNWRLYTLSLLLFIAALLSKTVTATLPAALALILWWKKPRLTAHDILPLLPMLALGLMLAFNTARLEVQHVHAQGAAWNLSLVERTLIAGRALWFYAGALAFPRELIFNYPRWSIDAHALGQYLYPLGALAVIAALWGWRQRLGKGPLVAVLFFAGTLVPALGFVNTYPMLFSFVADHFQYLASIGLLSLAAAAGTALAQRHGLSALAARTLGGATLALLAVLSFNQGFIYESLPALWTDTLAKNPNSWLAYNNLGSLAMAAGDGKDALSLYRQALAINPDAFAVLLDLGGYLINHGDIAHGRAYLLRAQEIHPDSAKVYYNLGNAALAQQNDAGAQEQYATAIGIDAHYTDAHYNLGLVLLHQGKWTPAATEFQTVVSLRPDWGAAYTNWGRALAAQGLGLAAIGPFAQACHLNPERPDAFDDLARALVAVDAATAPDHTPTVALAQHACQMTSFKQPLFLDTLACAYQQAGEQAKAKATLQQAVALATSAGQSALAAVLKQHLAQMPTTAPGSKQPR